MRLVSFHGRPGGRGRSKLRSWEWWASAYLPRFWNRRCSPECRYGQAIQRGCERHYFDPHNLCEACFAVEGVALDRYDHREGCPRQPKYLGHVAKGWWHLWTLRDSLWRWSSELLFAIGGEDNMAQISVMLPILGRVAVGFAVPRRWTKGWVYQRREFGIELRGLWPTLLIAYDSDASDMHDYYRDKRAKIEAGTQVLDGTHRDYLPPRAAIWPGWRTQVPTWRIGRLKNRVLGSYEHIETVLKVYDDVSVTLPEGDYPGKVTFYRSMMKRPRWPRARRDEVYGKFESESWMPWPGKGENSWDCGDDGTKEHTVTIGPGRIEASEIDQQDIAKVLGSTVAHVLKYRGRYGRADWKPEGVGVMRD